MDPSAAANPARFPRAMLRDPAVPLINVAGGRDPWYGLGLPNEAPPANGRYFYRADGCHCPYRSDRALGREILATLRALALPHP